MVHSETKDLLFVAQRELWALYIYLNVYNNCKQNLIRNVNDVKLIIYPPSTKCGQFQFDKTNQPSTYPWHKQGFLLSE